MNVQCAVTWTQSNSCKTAKFSLNFSDTCQICCFHGGDYEECRLVGYKNQVPTSQETRYVSATESSRLMLRKIGGFHGDD
jgi:hypothetical protein